MSKTWLMVLGIGVILIGSALLVMARMGGKIDSGSVGILLAEDRIGSEDLTGFQFTPWCEPGDEIRPFVSDRRSFADCEIVRYRCGTRSHWLLKCTYYEAQYKRPDGSLVVGPVMGPHSYAEPNYVTCVSVIVAGAILFLVGLLRRPERTCPSTDDIKGYGERPNPETGTDTGRVSC